MAASLRRRAEEQRLRVGVAMLLVDVDRIGRLGLRFLGGALGDRHHLVPRLEYAGQHGKDADHQLRQRTHVVAAVAAANREVAA